MNKTSTAKISPEVHDDDTPLTHADIASGKLVLRKRSATGAVLLNKQRVNIFLDSAVVEHYQSKAAGRGFQTLINEALKRAIQADAIEVLDESRVMETVIRKWGNTPAVRLPTSAIREAAFALEQKVNLTVTRGRIVIEPSSRVEFDLDELVAAITATNQHSEVGFGKPVGKEKL